MSAKSGMRFYNFLALVRPANVLTAISDILAGIALAGVFSFNGTTLPVIDIVLLMVATACLYGGGIVFNDVFDLETDKVERPERLLPSGAISRNGATYFGVALFSIGFVASGAVSRLSLYLSLGIILAALLYDKYFKHHAALGPVTMGICRGLNLLLGMSVLGILPNIWFICFMPLIFIAAITLTSRGEVSGNNTASISFALMLDTVVLTAILYLAFTEWLQIKTVLPFVLLWFGMNAVAKYNAIKENTSQKIMKAVKIGVISLIPLNASYAAGSSNWMVGLVVLILLPLSLNLSKKFAVT